MTVNEVIKNNNLQLDVEARDYDQRGISYDPGYGPDWFDDMPEFLNGDFIKILYGDAIIWVLAADVDNDVYYEFDPETYKLTCLRNDFDSRHVLAIARPNVRDMCDIAPVLEDLLDADSNAQERALSYLWVVEDYAKFRNWPLPEEADEDPEDQPLTVNEIAG